MLIEIIEMAFGGGLFSTIGYYIGHRSSLKQLPSQPKLLHRIPWCAIYTTSAKYPTEQRWFYKCPMCQLLRNRTGEERLEIEFCQCDETPHFHYECPDCGFEAFMDPPPDATKYIIPKKDTIVEDAQKEVEECLKK